MPPTIQLSLENGVGYDVGKDVTDYYATPFAKGDKILEATKPSDAPVKGYAELDTIPLYRLAYHDPKLDHDQVIQARVELHQRLALPPACLLLALIGIPLGVSSRKGGKSTSFVVTVALAFIYWIGLLAANGLAKDQRLPVFVAMWIPNAVFAVVGMFLSAALERPGDRDIIALLTGWVPVLWQRIRRGLPPRRTAEGRRQGLALLFRPAGRGHLRSAEFPVLLLDPARQLRADDARLHVLRAVERHCEEPHRDDARIHLSLFPDAAVDFRFGAVEHFGRRAGDLRHPHQAQRDHGLQSHRNQPVPAGGAGAWRRRFC